MLHELAAMHSFDRQTSIPVRSPKACLHSTQFGRALNHVSLFGGSNMTLAKSLSEEHGIVNAAYAWESLKVVSCAAQSETNASTKAACNAIMSLYKSSTYPLQLKLHQAINLTQIHYKPKHSQIFKPTKLPQHQHQNEVHPRHRRYLPLRRNCRRCRRQRCSRSPSSH